MNGNFSPSLWLNKFMAWGAANIWTANTLLEIIFIAICLAIGWILGRMLRKRITNTIENSKLPVRIKRIALSIRRLIPAAISLILLVTTAQILSSPWIDMSMPLAIAVSKVLFAWIAIGIALQIIEHPLIRSISFWAIWIIAALSIFDVLEPTLNTLDNLALNIGKVRLSALEVVKGGLLLLILLYVALFVSTFFEREVLKSKTLTRSSQVLIAKTIRIVLILIAVIIGLNSAGIDLSMFTVLSGAIGLGIGFGLQRSISNIFSGMLLLMDQSIKPGDVIELEKNGTYGWVNKMAARYTEVVTRDNKSYLIPNDEFITQRVVNWSHGNSLIRIELPFAVNYDSNPHNVIRIAIEIANRPDRRIVDKPKPVCYLRAFGDSAMDFILYFWITDAEHGITSIKSQILLDLWDALKAAGIKIPHPQRKNPAATEEN